MKTKDDIRILMSSIFKECQDTREDGQKEYAHDNSNAFANFERTAADLGISREMVLLIFFNKHKDGVIAYVKGHKSQREDIRGRIKDMIVYLCLLWGMVDDNDGITTAHPDAVEVLEHIEKFDRVIAKQLNKNG